MFIPEEFKDIRPFEPDEMPAAFRELLADESFCSIVRNLFPGVPFEALKAKLATCTDSLDFQKKFLYDLVKRLMADHCDGCTMNADAVPDRSANYTFISNHRDIVLDSAFLDVLLLDSGFSTTVEIAIGDNLLIYPWIKTLVRLNKSFIVRRNPGIREMLASSRLMSRYMHFALCQKHANLWIAQREGRAKNSDDRTQESVLKMLAMGGEGTPLESLRELNIVPLAITYEYDPCDYLKAREFQLKRDCPDYRKTQAEDLLNMQTGIFGPKGRVHFTAAPPVNTWIDQLAALPKKEFFSALAARIDRAIHSSYRLFPVNSIAADAYQNVQKRSANYTAEDQAAFMRYIDSRIALIDIPGKDETFLRQRLLQMYAMPLINQETALA